MRIRSRLEGDLWDWGVWANAAKCEGLSYPPFSVEGRMMANGGFAPSIFGSKIPRYFPNHYILKLDKKINKLNDKDKEILTMRYSWGCSYDDIGHARAMTVRQVGYALEKIREVLISL